MAVHLAVSLITMFTFWQKLVRVRSVYRLVKGFVIINLIYTPKALGKVL